MHKYQVSVPVIHTPDRRTLNDSDDEKEVEKPMTKVRALIEEHEVWRMQFLEDGYSPLPADIARSYEVEKKVGRLRSICQVAMFLQVFFLYIPCLAMVINIDSSAGVLRIIGILTALFLTVYASFKINNRSQIPSAFLTALFTKCCAFPCEMTMLSMEGDYYVPMIFGLLSVGVTFVNVTTMAITFIKIQPLAEFSLEEYYTKFVTKSYEAHTKYMVSLKRWHDLDNRFDDDSEEKARLFPPNALMKKWNQAYLVRRQLHRQETVGYKLISFIFGALIVLLLSQIVYEFSKVFLNQLPLFSEKQCTASNDVERVKTYFPNVSHSAMKVHLVVMDGLRYDLTNPGRSDLAAYLESPEFKPFSKRYLGKSQLPSFSVPNWVAILTGAPPENTGVTGNLKTDATYFDNIFRQAKNYNVRTGMTGDPGWKDLVTNELEPFDADGTVLSTYVPKGTPKYPWDTTDPGDWERLRIALKAVQRARGTPEEHRFFLTHFSDIDKQGREYGIDEKWNTHNTYMGAITNKTAALKAIVDATSEEMPTMIIVTSGHGHVMRGGNGGVSPELLDIPVIFFTKNRVMNLSAAYAFTDDLEPRLGAMANIDISATITALLGIPSPRQSLGIFFEQIVRTYVPAEKQGLHYLDLFLAKRAALMIYHEVLYPWDPNPQLAFPLQEPDIVRLVTSEASTTDPMLYANATRKILKQIESLRNLREQFIYYRNLIAALFVLIVNLILLISMYDNYSMVSFQAMFDASDPSCKINRKAFFISFLAVFLFYAFSITTFILGYFVFTGYQVWDSTYVHSPSVVRRFIALSIVGPAIYYILIFRGVQCLSFHWRVFDVIKAFRAKQSLSISFLATCINCICQDCTTIVFGTDAVQTASFPFSYLFTQYSVIWTMVSTQLMMFLAFPYSFIFPVALSSTHVTEFNLEWRFRIITLQIMTVPLLIGLMGQHYKRPPFKDSTLLTWDNLFMELLIKSDKYRLERLVENQQAAAKNAAQDRQKRELVEAKNSADTQLNIAEYQLREWKFVSHMEMENVSKLVTELRAAMDNVDVGDLQGATDKLRKAVMECGRTDFQQAAAKNEVQNRQKRELVEVKNNADAQLNIAECKLREWKFVSDTEKENVRKRMTELRAVMDNEDLFKEELQGATDKLQKAVVVYDETEESQKLRGRYNDLDLAMELLELPMLRFGPGHLGELIYRCEASVAPHVVHNDIVYIAFISPLCRLFISIEEASKHYIALVEADESLQRALIISIEEASYITLVEGDESLQRTVLFNLMELMMRQKIVFKHLIALVEANESLQRAELISLVEPMTRRRIEVQHYIGITPHSLYHYESLQRAMMISIEEANQPYTALVEADEALQRAVIISIEEASQHHIVLVVADESLQRAKLISLVEPTMRRKIEAQHYITFVGADE